MEDTYAVDLSLDSRTGMLAVFDGHGGGECAAHCSDNLVSAIKSTPGWQQGDLRGALGQAFLALDTQLVRDGSAPSSCGTTGTVALLQGSTVVVAGVGDSKAVMMHNGRVIPMTVDHRPNAPEEEARIRSAGGFVHRGRVNACLNISRALGDAQFKTDACRPACEQQVSPEPDVRESHVAGLQDFLLVCSDGVWNSMKDSAVLRFVKQRLLAGMAPGKVCEELCAACLEPCRTAYDNITCILCTFTRNALQGHADAPAGPADMPQQTHSDADQAPAPSPTSASTGAACAAALAAAVTPPGASNATARVAAGTAPGGSTAGHCRSHGGVPHVMAVAAGAAAVATVAAAAAAGEMCISRQASEAETNF